MSSVYESTSYIQNSKERISQQPNNSNKHILSTTRSTTTPTIQESIPTLDKFDFKREHKYAFLENKCFLLPCWSIYGNVLSLNLPKGDDMSGDSTFGIKTMN